jgi:hypothetical protein
VRVVGVCPFFVTQPSFEGFWPDRSCPAFFIIGAADKPRRAGKPQAFPPEVGFIRWLCGAKRQATGGCLSAAPLSRARSVRDNEEMSGEAQRSPLDLLVLPQPRDFYLGKIDKIIKFQWTCAAAVAYPHQSG